MFKNNILNFDFRTNISVGLMNDICSLWNQLPQNIKDAYGDTYFIKYQVSEDNEINTAKIQKERNLPRPSVEKLPVIVVKKRENLAQ